MYHIQSNSREYKDSFKRNIVLKLKSYDTNPSLLEQYFLICFGRCKCSSRLQYTSWNYKIRCIYLTVWGAFPWHWSIIIMVAMETVIQRL